MTRKHYALIANVLIDLRKASSLCFDNEDDFIRIIHDFAEMLAKDNENFDYRKFRNYIADKI